ncbi:MAG: MurR/RpiR family transcriptional regulator [Clostridium sp.]
MRSEVNGLENIEILTKIKTLYESLTNKEKKVAEFILTNHKQASYMGVADFSKECDVAEATIFRFCKKLGYSGYHEFKQLLVEEIQNISDEKNDYSINKAHKDINTMIKDTLQLSSHEKINRVAKLIMESNNIYLYGVGFSGLSAIGSQIRLSSMGYKAFAITEQYLQLLSANTIKRGDLAIGFSISGRNKSTVENLTLAKENGASIVSFTNYDKSPITEVSDITLLTAGKELGEEGSTLITEMSQLFVLEQIFNRLHELDDDRISSLNSRIHLYIKSELNNS